MEHFQRSVKTSDGYSLAYDEFGTDHARESTRGDEGRDRELLILLHGFTGSADVFKRIVPFLIDEKFNFRVIVPDLRGHGRNQVSKGSTGYHVSRLAMDLHDLLNDIATTEKTQLKESVNIIGASLGCAVIWSHFELFGPAVFKKIVFVDQAPLQNYDFDWGPEYGNRSCNSAQALAQIQETLRTRPDEVYKATIASCLAYRSHPLVNVNGSSPKSKTEIAEDEEFFLRIARMGQGTWFAKLMGDHTSLDWRDSIRETFNASRLTNEVVRIFVIASTRSGCFPSAGPLVVVDLVNGDRAARGLELIASGTAIDWAGHWCYWEEPEMFIQLISQFLKG